MAGAKFFVDNKINERKKVLMFTKRHSPESKKIKELFDEYKLSPQDFENCDIGRRHDCTEIENYLLFICLLDTRTVPQIFIGGRYVGGENEIQRLHESGELQTLLDEAK